MRHTDQQHASSAPAARRSARPASATAESVTPGGATASTSSTLYRPTSVASWPAARAFSVAASVGDSSNATKSAKEASERRGGLLSKSGSISGPVPAKPAAARAVAAASDATASSACASAAAVGASVARARAGAAAGAAAAIHARAARCRVAVSSDSNSGMWRARLRWWGARKA